MMVGEIREIVQDEGEAADIERLLDQPGEDVGLAVDRPEQPGEGDIDADQHGGERGNIAAARRPKPLSM